MAYAMGSASLVSDTQSTATVTATAASGGTGPYDYQWYRSTTSGFTVGSTYKIAGATSLTYTDTSLVPGTQYYYICQAIDTGAASATASSNQLGVLTLPPQPLPNQFAQTPQLGTVDLVYNYNTVSAQIDTSQVGSVYPGMAVKMTATAGGVPKVVGCSANSDTVWGFINYDIKSQGFSAGSFCECSLSGNVIWLYSTGAITRGSQVTLDLTTQGGVAQKVTSSGAAIVGYALDSAAAAGALIRVQLSTPSFQTA